MAKKLIGKVKPMKGVDYFTQEDIEELGEIFAKKEDIDNLTEYVAELDRIIAPATESTEYPGCYYRMVNGVQEWINPPMVADVEYCTTDRYMGKPVYVKLVNFGGLPKATSKAVDFAAAGVVEWVVSAQAQGQNCTIFPTKTEGMDITLSTFATVDTAAKITIATSDEFYADSQAYVLVRYTKL